MVTVLCFESKKVLCEIYSEKRNEISFKDIYSTLLC